MKKIHVSIVAGCLAATGGAAMATEYGRVVSATPVTAQVQVPEQQCTDQQQQVPARTGGGGALLGAVIGGVVGHNLGDGFGRAAATGLGVVAGSVIGDRVEAANTATTDIAVRNCQTWMRTENRLIGYDVVYDYQGRRFATRLSQDPGQSIALNVNVVPASDVVAEAPPSAPQAVVAAPPTVVYVTPPGYVSYGYGYGYGSPWVGALPIIAVGGYASYGYYGRYGGHGYGGRGHRR